MAAPRRRRRPRAAKAEEGSAGFGAETDDCEADADGGGAAVLTEGGAATATAGETMTAAAASAVATAATASSADAQQQEHPVTSTDGANYKRRHLRPCKLRRKVSAKITQHRLRFRSKLGMSQSEKKNNTPASVALAPPRPLDEPLSFPDRTERAQIF